MANADAGSMQPIICYDKHLNHCFGRKLPLRVLLVGAALAAAPWPPALAEPAHPPYAIADTGQSRCYGPHGPIACPARPDEPFFGQDAQFRRHPQRYRDNGDGTVSDLVTGLMWEKQFGRASFAEASRIAAASRVGRHSDWRVPSIKELYSLISFDGATGSARPETTGAPADARPYLDTVAFAFEYPAQGRFIDAQYVTRTAYLGLTMGRDRSFFGVNFADGRIKAYPQDGGPGGRVWYLRNVRGNPAYGVNDFADNGDGTVTDRATGLTWTRNDSGDPAFRPLMAATRQRDGRLDWGEALAFCARLSLAGKTGWRLPDAKELHSIVDYTRAPDVTGSAALDPIFGITAIADDEGKRDWPFFWTSTSHLDGRVPGEFAVYIAFGRAQGHVRAGGAQNGERMGDRPPPPGGGRMGGPPPPGGPMMGRGPMMGAESGGILLDVHGAGAQRSSPKSGDESRLPKGAGPQGDILRIYNYARCVRG